MALEYNKISKLLKYRLGIMHNPKKAKIRAFFFRIENEFFKKHIQNSKVLVAGSGLGHDSFELAKYNKQVIGVELFPALIKIAKQKAKEMKLQNVKFIKGDFTKLKYKSSYFDSAVLNMGTIGNFDDRTKVIRELLRVSKVVYLDFYPPSLKALEKRKKMHEEEGWKNVRIRGTKIISDDGLESASISKDELRKIVSSIGARVKFYNLCDFAMMAEIKKY